MCPHYRRSKGAKRYLGDLEILPAPGDTDNGDAQKTPQDKVAECEIPSGQDKPQDVQKKRTGSSAVLNILPEGVQRYGRELEALDADRDTYYRYAP